MSLSEELVRVPLVIRAPGVAAGRRAQPVSLADVAPTLLELAGLAPLDGVDGRSLVALLRGERLVNRPVLLGQRGIDALRGTRLKLVRDDEGDHLFDVADDPQEDTDLSAERPDEAARLARSLDAVLAGLAAESGSFGDASLDAAIEEELRRLGYLGGR